jgi:hypothetical protein
MLQPLFKVSANAFGDKIGQFIDVQFGRANRIQIFVLIFTIAYFIVVSDEWAPQFADEDVHIGISLPQRAVAARVLCDSSPPRPNKRAACHPSCDSRSADT